MIRKILTALVIFMAVLIPTTTAEAATPSKCGTKKLASRAEVRACWGGLISRSCNWPVATMVKVVYRESNGYPRAHNKTPVKVRVGRRGYKIVHAHGLFQKLGETSNNPEVQARNACALYKRQGIRAWRLTAY